MKYIKRLKYEKVGDVVLDIDLNNGYVVRAIAKYNYDNKNYITKFYLKEKTIDKFSLICDLDDVVLEGNYKTINSEILKYTTTLLSSDSLKNAIEQYEYEIKCFDRGNNEFEDDNVWYKPIKEKIAYCTFYYCPRCESDLGDDYTEEYQFCPRCGVRLDWSDIY